MQVAERKVSQPFPKVPIVLREWAVPLPARIASHGPLRMMLGSIALSRHVNVLADCFLILPPPRPQNGYRPEPAENPALPTGKVSACLYPGSASSGLAESRPR